MKRLLMGVLALLAVETAALACSCIATDDPAELRRLAKDSAPNALAVVEATALTSFEETRAGERMAVGRVLAGQAPAAFQVERGDFPSSASCDVLYQKGQPALMILYASSQPGGDLPVYRTSGLCTSLLLEKPAFRDELVRQIARPAGPERG